MRFFLYNEAVNKEEFLAQYPRRKPDSSKLDNGRVLLVCGSDGMAGAASLNILGAKCIGASYIHACVPSSIYPIVASWHMDPVFHPDPESFFSDLQSGFLSRMDAVGIGSGMTRFPKKEEFLRAVLQQSDVPVVIDAEGLRILSAHPEFLDKAHADVVLTPHIGEFSALTHASIEDIRKSRKELASAYARRHHLFLALKGHVTLVASPDGSVRENHSGSEALARAGSGDLLTGMVSGMCALNHDTFTAVQAAVWLHGHLADEWGKDHSKACLDFPALYAYADRFFKEAGL